MKSNMNFALCFLLTCLVLAGCNRNGRSTEIAIALTQTAAVAATETAIVPTNTPIPPSATPVAPLETATPTPPPQESTTAQPVALPAPLYFLDGQSRQVAKLDADGKSVTIVTQAEAPLTDFALSPDGTRLAYVSNNALYEANADGTGAILKVAGEVLNSTNQEGRIVRDLRAPRYSPDSATIAFGLGGVNLIESGPATESRLVLASSPYPTAADFPLSADKPVRFYWPGQWSPDGSKLLVEFAYYPESGGLVILDPVSGALTEVTGQDDVTVICCEAVWQPDGLAIYLASNFLAYGTPGVAIIDVRTGLTANLVGGLPSDQSAAGPFRFFRAPFWIDGRLRAMMNETADLAQIPSAYQPVTVADNGIVSTLSNATAELSGQVAWAPDGSGLAFSDIPPGTDTRNAAPFFWLSMEGNRASLPVAGSRPVWGPLVATPDSDADQVAAMDGTAADLAQFAGRLWSVEPAADASGLEGIYAFPLETTGDGQRWVAHTTGLRGFDPVQFHTIGLFDSMGDAWKELARIELGKDADIDNADPVPDYLSSGSVFQVDVEPSRLWLQVEGGVGAHSGTFNLLSYDGETLQTEAGGFSSSPGVGEIADINADRVGEVLLDATDYYVFCYACGVQLPQYDVLRWTGDRFEPVPLALLPADAPDELREANDRAVELAGAGLWKDALALMLEALETGENHADYDWNLRLIQLNSSVKRGEALDTESGYDILDNIFYGDYAAAVEVMRPLPVDEIFSLESPLIVDTPAEGSTEILADWVARTSTSALGVMPDLAPALFLLGWSDYLATDDLETALPNVARAAAAAPDDLFYREAVGFLAGDPAPTRAPVLPTPAASDAPTPTPASASVATEEAAGEVKITATVAPPTPATTGGRLFFSAQNQDGQTAIFQLLPNSSIEQIVVDAAQPAIQPGGDRLAFHSLRDDMLGLGGFDLAAQERVRFSFNVEDSMPTWDPGPQQIIFSSTRYGDGKSRLYQVWADGRGDAVDLGFGQDPDWRPTEARVAFRGCDETGGRCGLWTMQPDGTGRTPLTDNPGDARPDWSPNGRYVLFMSNERDGNWEIYRVDADSGAVLRLTDNPANDGLPAVSPDGSEVAFMSNRGGVWSLQVVSIEGGPARTLYEIGDNVADWLEQGIEWER